MIGVPDPTWGEQVAAVLILRAGHDRPSVEQLTGHIRRQVAAHKSPVFWAFRDELPMTPTGKIQKFVLRDEATKACWRSTRSGRSVAPASSGARPLRKPPCPPRDPKEPQVEP